MDGVWGNCRRPRRGVLVPDVEGTGLPLTELLPYMKIKTRQIKKHHKINVKQKRGAHTGKRWRRRRKRERDKEEEARERERKRCVGTTTTSIKSERNKPAMRQNSRHREATSHIEKNGHKPQ